MSELVEGRTFRCPKCGQEFTAKNAIDEINPDTIKAAIETFKSSVEERTEEIINMLKLVEEDVENAVKVKNDTYLPQIEQVETNAEDTKSEILNTIDSADIYSYAIRVHNYIQNTYNEQAHTDCESHYNYEHPSIASEA